LRNVVYGKLKLLSVIGSNLFCKFGHLVEHNIALCLMPSESNFSS
jgi:hypothetical protein